MYIRDNFVGKKTEKLEPMAQSPYQKSAQHLSQNGFFFENHFSTSNDVLFFVFAGWKN